MLCFAADDEPLVSRSVIVPSYGSTENPSTADPKQQQRSTDVHHRPTTSTQDDDDASHPSAPINDNAGSRTAVSSMDKETAKPKRLIRNSNCQPVSSSTDVVVSSQPPAATQTTQLSVNHPSVNVTLQNSAALQNTAPSNCVSPCTTTRPSTSISSASVVVSSSSISIINQKSCSRDLPETYPVATRQTVSISSQCPVTSRNAGHNSFPSVCDSPSNIPQLIIELRKFIL